MNNIKIFYMSITYEILGRLIRKFRCFVDFLGVIVYNCYNSTAVTGLLQAELQIKYRKGKYYNMDETKKIKKKKNSKPVVPEKGPVFNAKIDHLIIEYLKEAGEKGLCKNELDTKLKKDMHFSSESNMRTRIDSRIQYLMEFGKQTGLFEIRDSDDDAINDDNDDDENYNKEKGKRKPFYYMSKMSNAEIQLMLRSFRAVKGKPVDEWSNRFARDPETGHYKVVRNSRRFFADLTTEGFIRSFDKEEPDDLRNKKMTENMKIIMSAVNNKNALAVRYGDYNVKKELCPRKDKNGKDTFIIYPIKMVVSLGRYYLYCQYKERPPKTEDEDERILYSLRVDRIISCKELDEKYEINEDVKKIFKGVGEPHFAQRLYMFTGSASRITFLTDEKHLNDVFDWFGNVRLRKQSDNTIEVTVHADKNAMLYWALQYCRYVKVTSPPELVDRIKKTLSEASERYGEG